MTADLFTGPPDPRDVRARLRDLSRRPGSDQWVARAWIEDETDDEGVEVVCQVSDSLRCTHSLEPDAIESTVARHINLWQPEHRLVAARARTELGGEYALGGDSDALYLVELPIAIPA